MVAASPSTRTVTTIMRFILIPPKRGISASDGTAMKGAGQPIDQMTRSPRLDLGQAPRLYQVNKDIPFFPLEDGHVRIFTDADLVIVDDDFRASRTPGAERVLFHIVSPPPASMCGQTVPWSPLVSGHVLRMRRPSVRSAIRSVSFAPTGVGRERTVPPHCAGG